MAMMLFPGMAGAGDAAWPSHVPGQPPSQLQSPVAGGVVPQQAGGDNALLTVLAKGNHMTALERISRPRELHKISRGGGGRGNGEAMIAKDIAVPAVSVKVAAASGSDGSGSSAQTLQQQRAARHWVVEESSQRETSPLCSEQQ